MKGIITLCVRRPVTMLMLMAAVFMGAVYSIRLLPLNKLPEIIYPKVTVETAYPGMGAAEVRASVTIPLEDSLSAVKGLEGIKSVSRDETSLLLLSFRWGTDPARAAALVRGAIDTVYPGLPQGVSKPAVIYGDPFDEPHAVVAVRSLSGNNSAARNFAEYELRSRFRRLDGAGRVSVSGGEREEIRVRSDPARLTARSLNGNDLAGIIAGEITDFPAGSAREGNRELTVVSSGRPRSEEELAALVVAAGSGPLKVGDLAKTAREISRRQSLFIFQNTDQTALEIYRRPGSDPVQLSLDIKKVIEESSRLFSRDAEIILVFDTSPSIIQGIRDLGISGSLAALAVILILALFMGRLRYSILAALSLPFSASAALIVLAAAGGSLNSMSLGGLALGIGLVSDTSVIVLDLFCRKFEGAGRTPSPDEAGALAASVSLSNLAGTLTTVAVFLPVIFLPGSLGALFGDLALALIVSVASGWFYAQFCIPSLFSFFPVRGTALPDMISGKAAGTLIPPPRIKPEKIYGLFLEKVFRHPFPALAVSFLASLAGTGLLFSRPVEFIAPESVSEIEVALDFPAGTPPENAVPLSLEVSKILSRLDGILSFYGRMGAEADDPSRRADPDYQKEKLLFRCFLETPDEGGDALQRIRGALDGFNPSGSGLPLISAGYPADRTAGILGLSSALTLAVKGSSPEESLARAKELAETIRCEAGSGLDSFRLRPSGTRPQLRLLPRREISALLGVSAMEIAAALYAASEGIVAGKMEIEGRPLDIRVSGTIPEDDPRLLQTLPFSVSSSAKKQNPGPVLLGSLAGIEWVEAETALARQDRSDLVYLDIFPAAGKEKKINGLVNGIRGEDRTIFRPAAGSLLRGVSRADESVFVRYRGALAATVMLVLILLYLILGAQFESFLLPFILMLAIPFSLAGAGPALLLSRSSLDSGAALGLVALFGIAVNNGIVLYEISEEKIRAGFLPQAAVYSGALERFRPVLLTSLTTVFALLPLVVSPLGNSQRGMAAAMLGGIIVSGFFAFFALPPVFVRFFENKKRRAND